ncbi:hypothetical protein RRG08_049861 [Elysia crispata]|uniref:Uncharacterized protein n=1 Tax=Elysia crispata TaxID=231223 RepID=A0AAE1DMA4_9GAST|nr:hypothetical protein RRG08_049861 [Elysia crispata]
MRLPCGLPCCHQNRPVSFSSYSQLILFFSANRNRVKFAGGCATFLKLPRFEIKAPVPGALWINSDSRARIIMRAVDESGSKQGEIMEMGQIVRQEWKAFKKVIDGSTEIKEEQHIKSTFLN